MNKYPDVFGQTLYDYLSGDDVAEIIERSDGFISHSAHALESYFADYPDWPRPLKEAIAYVRGRTLDIGCGPGRVLMHLHKKGIEALGIDTSPLALKICRERGLKNVKQLSITELTPKHGPFDTLIMFGNNFGLFGSFNRARTLLKRFYKMTSPNARIIAQTIDPYKTECQEHLAYHRQNRSRGRMGGQIRLRSRHKNLIGPWFDYLFVSRQEMKEILAGTGWKIRRLINLFGPGYVAIIEKENSA
jgi:SAM-dependent methyltransferase